MSATCNTISTVGLARRGLLRLGWIASVLMLAGFDALAAEPVSGDARPVTLADFEFLRQEPSRKQKQIVEVSGIRAKGDAMATTLWRQQDSGGWFFCRKMVCGSSITMSGYPIDSAGAKRLKRSVRLFFLLALAALMGCALPPGYSPEYRQINTELVQRALVPLQASTVPAADRPLGVYVGVALDGASPAFDGDIRRARDGLFLQSASGPSLLLSNLRAEPLVDPPADLATMPTVARAAGQWLQSQRAQSVRTPFALVVIASHGKEDRLMVRAGKTQLLAWLDGAYIKAFLNDLGAVPTIVIISACHAGSLIPALRAPNRIIIAAAAADRASFGCGADSNSTVFMQTLLDKDLDRSLSLEDLFMRGLNRVIALELRYKLTHSLPAMDVGSNMTAFAATPIAKWSTTLSEFRMSKP